MLRMYDYTKQYIELEQLLADGVIDQEQFEDNIESFEDDAQTKAENLGKMMDNFKAQAEMLKAEEDKLKKKRKTIENRITWFEQSLENHLKALGKDEYQAGIYRLTYDKLPDIVNFTNENSIPKAYKTYETVTKIDKRAISKALKDGEAVRGAELETNRRKFKVKK